MELTLAKYAPLRRVHRALRHGDDFCRPGRQAFNKEWQKEIGVGATVKIGPYELLLQAVDSETRKNYVAER